MIPSLRLASCVLGSLLIASMVASQGCGNAGSQGCAETNDNVTAHNDQITVSNGTLQPPGCKVLATPAIPIVADSPAGEADTEFSDGTKYIGHCAFLQLPGTPKRATFTIRDPANALFTEINGEADCTVKTMVGTQLCGLATVLLDGTPTGPAAMSMSCNNDPKAFVSVYRGSATVSLTSSTGVKAEPVRENDEVTVDFAARTFTHSVPHFTPDQISHFDVQLDALVGGVSLTDRKGLLQVPSLSPSNAVVAPNVLQKQLGQNYGNINVMCKQASSVPIVVYPASPNASTPRLEAGVCTNRTATVYGISVYRQGGLGFSGSYFNQGVGGRLVGSQFFDSPKTLVFGVAQEIFAWDGSLRSLPLRPASSPSSGFVPQDIYVLKLLYDLPPDTTLRIGFVAVSLFGAPFPAPIG